ncbi:MAG: hypothetical protein B5M52_04490 [Helicobacteraceae bacterium 4484_230]|nr:MAG: hypothetical protein B5M52_04490 [Helicobacteraceae bacterium 4484_230]
MKRCGFCKTALLCAVFSVICSCASASEFIVEDINFSKRQATWIALPYVFDSESMGFTGGIVGIFNGFFQPQLTIVATLYAGEKLEVKKLSGDQTIEKEEARTSGGFLAVKGYKPPFSKRMFVSFYGSYAYYPDQRLYLDGSNDSDRNIDSESPFEMTPLKTQGYNNWMDVDFRYVLPWGESRDDVLPVIKMKRGIAVNRDNCGGGVPFVTGQTVLGTELFYTKWTADKLTEEPSLNTNGMRFYLEHDNTDYPDNPSRGYNINARFSADFGLWNSTQSWNALDVSYSHYFEFGNFSWTRQNVIALNAWTAYSPSWDSSKKLNPDNPNAVIDKHRPPMWEGARLGGWNRMRAYDSNRFSDKAAVYFAAEYRLIPSLNPMQDQRWSPIPIDWFQVVLFAEAGRVAPHYELSTLFSDMKYDVGFSIRALAAKLPIRFDMAVGEEGSTMWVMVKQPF